MCQSLWWESTEFVASFVGLNEYFLVPCSGMLAALTLSEGSPSTSESGLALTNMPNPTTMRISVCDSLDSFSFKSDLVSVMPSKFLTSSLYLVIDLALMISRMSSLLNSEKL